MAKLDKIWIVENPTKLSTIVDICYSATPENLFNIARGTMGRIDDLGLSFYDNQNEATNDAEQRLKNFNRVDY